MAQFQQTQLIDQPTHHVAIMKKEWKLIPLIMSGKKKAESRWYKTRRTPWNKIKAGDTVFFKNSGELVTVKTEVSKVIQYEVTDNQHALEILQKHALDDLGLEDIPQAISDYTRNKNYAIFVFLKDPQEVEPFEIDKTGFGMQAAWLTVEDISQIKRPRQG